MSTALSFRATRRARRGAGTAIGRARRLVRGRADRPAHGCARRCSLCCRRPRCSTSGASAPRVGRTRSTRRPCRPAATSWKAFFFGSSDAANFITVDKPPASLWVMEISARVFGVNAWSILVPQALEGVATVAVLYATVRRWFTPAAGLLAGAVLALTPVAVLMFRFNNPDALLVLLLTLAAYAVTRALEAGEHPLAGAGRSLVGFGFLAKMMQAFLVVPAFASCVLACRADTRAPPDLAAAPRRRRDVRRGRRGGSLRLTLTPASARPYIGGSQHNSILELIFGYNGFGRLTGNETGSVTGGGAGGAGGGSGHGGSMWGPTGMHAAVRFGDGHADLVADPGCARRCCSARCGLSRREGRTSRLRAATVLWGATLLVSGLILSLSKGIIHPYYTVALAPAIGALVGIGGTELWRHRERLDVARVPVAAAVGGHDVVGARASRPDADIRIVAASDDRRGRYRGRARRHRVGHVKRGVAVAIAAGAMLTAVGAPVAFALDTASRRTQARSRQQGRRQAKGAGRFRRRWIRSVRWNRRARWLPVGLAAYGYGTPPTGRRAHRRTGPRARPGRRGGSAAVPAAARPAWQQHSERSTDRSVEGEREFVHVGCRGHRIQRGVGLSTRHGRSGHGDRRLQRQRPGAHAGAVREARTAGKIHYFIAGSVGTPNGGSNASSEISSWVSSHYTAVDDRRRHALRPDKATSYAS